MDSNPPSPAYKKTRGSKTKALEQLSKHMAINKGLNSDSEPSSDNMELSECESKVSESSEKRVGNNHPRGKHTCTCDMCGVSFTYKDLWPHMRDVHEGHYMRDARTRSIFRQCEVCDKFIVRKWYQGHINSLQHRKNVQEKEGLDEVPEPQEV